MPDQVHVPSWASTQHLHLALTSIRPNSSSTGWELASWYFFVIRLGRCFCNFVGFPRPLRTPGSSISRNKGVVFLTSEIVILLCDSDFLEWNVHVSHFWVPQLILDTLFWEYWNSIKCSGWAVTLRLNFCCEFWIALLVPSGALYVTMPHYRPCNQSQSHSVTRVALNWLNITNATHAHCSSFPRYHQRIQKCK